MAALGLLSGLLTLAVPVLLQPGATTFNLQAFTAGSGTQPQMSYAGLTLIPLH